ncbi:hypothetical protein BVC80_855g7 [Macleaya cordata]|uniref:Retrotransposon gag domain-containing protein n=1 Tax=Macleaya cordata TaxID=56857 RepID=A0A200PS18_MACCD|nr:hypothetical protein BVC80_855g7 [Macleaya cordata]
MVGNPGLHDDNAILKDFKSWRPTSYDGTPDPAKAEKWLKDIEKIFDLIRCIDELKVRMATYMLVDGAWDWWKSISEGMGPITWDEFQSLFLDRYFSAAVKEKKYYELMGLRQGNMTVDQYLARFTNLS